jgi:hypothetical protein
MRLLQSVLSCLKQTKKPQHKCVTPLLGLRLMRPGHATFRNMSRYSPYHDRTCARWYGRHFAGVSLHQAAITEVVPPAHEQAVVMDARVVPTSGQHTYGLDRFWNGRHSRAEKGLALSPLAWLALPENCASCLRVAQTPPSAATVELEATRMDVSLDHLRRVVKVHALRFLRSVVTDGADSKQQCVAGVRGLELQQIGTVRAAAKLRSLSQGPKRPGPGRQKTSDGKVTWSAFARFERLETEDEHSGLSHPVLHHVQWQCHLQVVVVVQTQRHRSAVLFSTAVNLAPQRLSRYDKARFQIAWLLRDAKPCTGLSDCPARSQAPLALHCHASVRAVTCAQLEARQHNGNGDQAFSMASLKRRAFNQHLLDRMCEHFAHGQSLEKSSPDYETLCNYGIIADEAA